MVRVVAVVVIVVMWVALIASGIKTSGGRSDTLQGYWDEMTVQQQDSTCDTYASYPDYTQNWFTGVLKYQVTAEQAREFLWRNCG